MIRISRRPAALFLAAALAGIAACQSTGGSKSPEDTSKRKPGEATGTGSANQPVADLRAALKDPDMSVRLKGVELIGPGVAGSEEGAAVLVGALGDSEPLVRRFAAEALSGAAPTTPTLLALAKTLSDSQDEPRESASRVLAKLVDKAPDDAVPELGAKLAAATSDPQEAVRSHALEALGNLGARGVQLSPPVEPALDRALADLSDQVRGTAVAAIGQLGTSVPGTVTLLIKALADPVHDVRKQAVVALEKMGPAAAPATKALAKQLHGKEIYLRVFAADALTAIGPGARAALPALRALAKSGYKDIKGSKEMEAKDLPAAVTRAIQSITGKGPAKGDRTQ